MASGYSGVLSLGTFAMGSCALPVVEPLNFRAKKAWAPAGVFCVALSPEYEKLSAVFPDLPLSLTLARRSLALSLSLSVLFRTMCCGLTAFYLPYINSAL